MSQEHSRSISPMDDLLNNLPNVYPQQQQQPQQKLQDSQPLASFPIAGADESWSGAVAGGSDWKTDSVEIGSGMTLEDYLTHNEAVREDVRAPLGYGQFHMPPPLQFQAVENPIVVCGNGSGSGSSGRGKRQAFEPPVDKATAQKQRRMIKNRESAARSRERKQPSHEGISRRLRPIASNEACQAQLETLVSELEEENAQLLREEKTAMLCSVVFVERTQQRFQQLMENVIPAEEKKKCPRVLRRVKSLP
ncbi:hypothetical protein G4B88_016807 [Cannabis sativa]|uniref:BZIP domain-containing protein n=1 Tax=Cannabis sativa TaxID=3483 RepID=A0A7J6GMZ7_CANSA|nr:hypothetical protein G4B88_016807 [Cannabis sativa]